MLNSITFYILNSLYSLVLFISNLFGGKQIKNVIQIFFGTILDGLDERKKGLIPPSHLAIAFVDKHLISYVSFLLGLTLGISNQNV